VTITRTRGICLLLFLGVIVVSLLAGLTQFAPTALAQIEDNRLDWRQRYLGIIPLVKPNAADPIVARVDRAVITLAQADSYARTEARLVNATTTEENKTVWRDALDNLVARQLLVEEAQRRKIAPSDAEVAQRARDFQVANVDGEQISTGGAPDPELIREVRATMQIETMLDQEFRTHPVKPTAAAIKSYYDEHQDLFVTDPGEIRISHIAVKLPADPTDAEKADAAARIKELYAEAEKSPDFAALAREKSEDSLSAPNGGDLGYFRPGQLPPVVEKIAFSTKVGHLSEIIESNIGYSFMKVTERNGAVYAPLKDVQPKIALVLLDYNQEAVVKSLLEKLRKKAKIEFPPPPGNSAQNPI
jgi:parvulin-like peptidyl-prolyl isomerase